MKKQRTLFFVIFTYLVIFLIVTALNASMLFGASFQGQDIFHDVDKGNISKLTSYLENNGDPNLVDEKKRSLLARAAYRGHYELADALLKAGALVDLEDQHKITPLYQASSAGHAAIVRLFVSKTHNINHIDERGATALHIASKKGHSSVVTELCLSPTIRLEIQTQDGETALWLACCKGHLPTTEILLQRNAHVYVNIADYHGVTPLLISSYYGFSGIVRALLRHGAFVNQVRDNGISPLIVASYQGHEDTVRILAEAGADILYQSPQELGGGNAYHYALQQDHRAISHYLHALSCDQKAEKKKQELEQALQELYYLKSSIQQITKKIDVLEEKECQQASELDHLKKQHLQTEEAEIVVLQHLKEQLDGMHIREQQQYRTLLGLEEQYAILSEHYNQNIHVEEQKRYLRSQDKLKVFYETVERTLNQLFLAYKVLDTGMVQRVTNSRLDVVAKGINILGSMVSLPFASLVTSTLSAGVSYAADQSAKHHIHFIANLVINIKTLEEESEQAARSLSFTYEEQIKSLTEEGAKILAQCGVGRLIDYMQAEQIKKDLKLAPQLIDAVATFLSYQGRFNLCHQSIETLERKDPKWTDKGIFQLTGIITGKGLRFALIGNDEYQHYGFRVGTEADVDRLRYRLVS